MLTKKISKQNKSYSAVLFLFPIFYALGVFFFDVASFSSLFLMFISVFVLWRSRGNSFLFVLVLMNAYFNYSIVVGEYCGFEWIGVGMVFSKVDYLYEKMITLMVVYNLGFCFIVFNGAGERITSVFDRQDYQPVIVFVSAILIVLIAIFGVDRSESVGYSVKITSVFEYSSLLIMFGIYFSGSNRALKGLMYAMAAFVIFEDLRLGGRITSLRVLVTIYLLHGKEHVTNKKTLIFFVMGVMLMAIMGSTRGFKSIDAGSILLGFFSSFFVFDTVVFSYYASIAQLMLYEKVDFSFAVQSLASVFNQIFLFGVIPDYGFFNLSGKASEAGYSSLGGGVAPSFFYFWSGYFGVFVFGVLTAFLYRQLDNNSRIPFVFIVATIAVFPRWFLYGPWSLPKTVYLISIFFLIYRLISPRRRFVKSTFDI